LAIASAVTAAISILVFALYSTGMLDRFEYAVDETRADFLNRTVDSDIVIVGIDGHSLEVLAEWPWPRSFHARLLQHLQAAAPAQVFFDIDFSSSAPDAEDDALLARELERWAGPPVMLAAHTQALQGSGGETSARRPLPQLRQFGREVSVELDPDRDGLVRRMRPSAEVGGQAMPSAFAVDMALNGEDLVRIDFSIDPASFDYISYSDLLNAEVDLDQLRGKKIFVGATSSELGDSIPVPRFQRLPGVVVQALASESVAQGVLDKLPLWLYGSILVLCAGVHTFVFTAGSWRKNTLVGAASVAVLLVATTLLYSQFRIEFDVIPFFAAAVASFVVAALRSLDRQTWRAMAYAVGIRRRDALLKSVIETSMDSIICIDAEGVIRTANPAASILFGLPLPSLLGSSVSKFFPALGRDFAGLAGRGDATEFKAVESSGRKFPVEATLSRVGFDNGLLYTMIVRDISQRKAQQKKLEYQATHDSLTDLPNREAVRRYLETVLASPDRDLRVAVMLVDLCRFKEVNDTLGHNVGDEVLQVVGQRFRDALSGDAFIGRIGGDEFCVIVPDVATRSFIDDLTQTLVESLQTPIPVRGIAIEVGLSIGIAFYPEHAGDVQELLRHADVAMYSAKRRNSRFEYYSRDEDRHTVRRLSMVSDLRTAISLNGIDLLFQPQVDLATGLLSGAEALLRWEHPVHGAVRPDEFIAIAESTDLIQPLTEWTISEALRQCVVWEQNGLPTRVAVNLSARSLQDVAFPRQLERLLMRFGVRSQWLELEITETAMMLDPQRALEIVRDIQALGVRISIDDYGTGYSSLGYLRDLNAHALKLDKSFVIDLERREHNRVIVESTAQMAGALGLEVVAEGIETAWVNDYLTRVGYGIGQGYWFGRAMPADQLFKKYEGRSANPRAPEAIAS
jgi:diguanylate cyclase (GGDEF)-like protein/PAS domain S-box-containing protein